MIILTRTHTHTQKKKKKKKKGKKGLDAWLELPDIICLNFQRVNEICIETQKEHL